MLGFYDFGLRLFVFIYVAVYLSSLPSRNSPSLTQAYGWFFPSDFAWTLKPSEPGCLVQGAKAFGLLLVKRNRESRSSVGWESSNWGSKSHEMVGFSEYVLVDLFIMPYLFEALVMLLRILPDRYLLPNINLNSRHNLLGRKLLTAL